MLDDTLATATLVQPGLFVGILAFGAAMVWVVEHSRCAPFFRTCEGVVAPFAAVPGLVFALFFAYLMTGITHDRVSARAAVASEAIAVEELGDTARLLGEGGTALHSRLADYVRLSTGDGWRSESRYRAAVTALSQLQWEVRHGLIPDSEQEVRGLIFLKIEEVGHALRDRFLLAETRPQKRK